MVVNNLWAGFGPGELEKTLAPEEGSALEAEGNVSISIIPRQMM